MNLLNERGKELNNQPNDPQLLAQQDTASSKTDTQREQPQDVMYSGPVSNTGDVSTQIDTLNEQNSYTVDKVDSGLDNVSAGLSSVGDDITKSVGQMTDQLQQGMKDQTAVLSGISGSMSDMSYTQRRMFSMWEDMKNKPDVNKDVDYGKDILTSGQGSDGALGGQSGSGGGTGLADLAAGALAGIYGLKKLKERVFKSKKPTVSNKPGQTSTPSSTSTSTSTKTVNKPKVKPGKFKLGGPIGKMLTVAAAIAGASSFFGDDDEGDADEAYRIATGSYPTNTPSNDPAGVGKVSAHFESGNRGAGTVSTGQGDYGGVSYGTHQLSSKTGTVQNFLQGNKTYGDQFTGLLAGSQAFNDKWEDIAKQDKDFGSAQHDYIKTTHYDKQVQKLLNNNIDLSDRSSAVQEALFSTSVQFGANTNVVKNAVGQNSSEMTDEQIINAIQNYKIENNDKLFRSSSESVRQSTLNRATEEKMMLLAMARTPTMGATTPAATSTPSGADVAVGTVTSSTPLDVKIAGTDTAAINAVTEDTDMLGLAMVGATVATVAAPAIKKVDIGAIQNTTKKATEAVKVGASKASAMVTKTPKIDALKNSKAISTKIFSKASTVAKSLGRGASKAIPGLGVVVGGLEAHSVLTDDTTTDVEKQVAMGSLAGGTAAGTAGAILGQILIPIPGVGALVGGTLGYMLGDWLGGSAVEAAVVDVDVDNTSVSTPATSVNTQGDTTSTSSTTSVSPVTITPAALARKKAALNRVIVPQPSATNTTVSKQDRQTHSTDSVLYKDVTGTHTVNTSPAISIQQQAPLPVRTPVTTKREAENVNRSTYNDVKNVNVTNNVNPRRDKPVKDNKTVKTNQLVSTGSQKPTLDTTPIMVNDIGVTLINMGHI